MMKFLWSTDAIRPAIITIIPTFYMQLTRAKVRPKKNVVTGPPNRGGGRCSFAVGCSVLFLPVLQQLFFRFHHADLYGRLQPWFLV